MSGHIQGELNNLRAVRLDQLEDVDVPDSLQRVLDHLDRSGTSISGYNGAGDDKTMSEAVVELPDE